MVRRIVITGCGVVTGAGNDLNEFWRNLDSGTCAVRPLVDFAIPGLEQPYGAVAELPASEPFPANADTDPYRGRCGHLALAAARRALEDAGIASRSPLLETAGTLIGTTLGEERQVGDLNERQLADESTAIDPGFFSRSDNHRITTLVAEEHGLGGPAWVPATACSSSNAAIALGSDLIRTGACDVVLVGGSDTLTRLTYCGFQRVGALAKTISRPFDKNRDGVAFGEGAGLLVLENLEHALARKARIRAEVAGYGFSNDAYHLTAPEPNGDGFVRAIRQALATSGVPLEQIGYVSAHGTGTPYNDLGEMRAMRTIFGERAPSVPISSVKSMIGHTNGAASSIESIACVMALMNQTVPPTANLLEPDPEFGLDHVPGQGRKHAFDACLKLGAGFGGFNVCLVLTRYQ